jgi:hypothetical protein
VARARAFQQREEIVMIDGWASSLRDAGIVGPLSATLRDLQCHRNSVKEFSIGYGIHLPRPLLSPVEGGWRFRGLEIRQLDAFSFETAQ